MTLCEKCIHGDVCGDRDGYDEGDERALTYCLEFKSKDDIVEVVRCKDCIFYQANSCFNRQWDLESSTEVPMVRDCDFCSYGERKDN
jgi:hypothetical protein